MAKIDFEITDMNYVLSALGLAISSRLPYDSFMSAVCEFGKLPRQEQTGEQFDKVIETAVRESGCLP